jgi:hypothetical protein
MTFDSVDVPDKMKTIRELWMTLPNALPAPPGGSWLDELESYAQSALGLLKMHIGTSRPLPQPDISPISTALSELNLIGECLHVLVAEMRQQIEEGS